MKGICFLCGNWEELEEHHIFTGALRPLSTKYKATVRLCPWCHRIDEDAVHKSRDTREYIQDYGQRKVMREQGWTVDEFRAVFGKNYLLDGTSNARPYECETETEDNAGGGFFALIDEPMALPY